MKKLFFLCCVATVFVSCKKDKDISDVPWKLQTDFVSAERDVQSDSKLATFVIMIRMKAVGRDLFILPKAIYGASVSGQWQSSISYAIETPTEISAAASTSTYALISKDGTIPDTIGRYYLLEGHTYTFLFKVYLVSPGAGNYRLRMSEIQGFPAEGDPTVTKLNRDQYVTEYVRLQ